MALALLRTPSHADHHLGKRGSCVWQRFRPRAAQWISLSSGFGFGDAEEPSFSIEGVQAAGLQAFRCSVVSWPTWTWTMELHSSEISLPTGARRKLFSSALTELTELACWKLWSG